MGFGPATAAAVAGGRLEDVLEESEPPSLDASMAVEAAGGGGVEGGAGGGAGAPLRAGEAPPFLVLPQAAAAAQAFARRSIKPVVLFVQEAGE